MPIDNKSRDARALIFERDALLLSGKLLKNLIKLCQALLIIMLTETNVGPLKSIFPSLVYLSLSSTKKWHKKPLFSVLLHFVYHFLRQRLSLRY